MALIRMAFQCSDEDTSKKRPEGKSGFPTATMRRGDEFVIPRGDTALLDGDRIIVTVPVEAAGEERLILIQNFFEELKEPVPN